MLVLRISSKIALNSFGVIIFQGFAVPSLQTDASDLQSARSDRPVLANAKHSTSFNASSSIIS